MFIKPPPFKLQWQNPEGSNGTYLFFSDDPLRLGLDSPSVLMPPERNDFSWPEDDPGMEIPYTGSGKLFVRMATCGPDPERAILGLSEVFEVKV